MDEPKQATSIDYSFLSEGNKNTTELLKLKINFEFNHFVHIFMV